MAQVIQQKFDKQLLSQLPQEEFQGRIIVVNNLIDAGKAVRYLMEQPIIGIDTETKPVFKKGAANKVALLQVSTHDTAFLFQLREMPFGKELVEQSPQNFGNVVHVN